MNNGFRRGLGQLIFAISAGVLGVALFLLFMEKEEEYGLNWLFNQRGAIAAPSDVVVIAIDQFSATKLGYEFHPTKWPRSIHADLIDKLIEAGVKTIAFDLRFKACGSKPENNARLASAINKAGNVVLVERLIDSRDIDHSLPYQARNDLENCETDNENNKISLNTEKREAFYFQDYPKLVGAWREPVLHIFAEAAKATAPFILPRRTVTQYWTFKTSAGDVPSLPSVVLQIFALQAYDDFFHLLHVVDPILAAQIPVSGNDIDIEDLMLTLRNIFISNTKLSNAIQHVLDQNQVISESHRKILHALINLYSGGETRYLNFYGPPRSVRTIPYHQVLQSDATGSGQLDLRGKAVFIGVSANSLSEQDELRDDYVTVFQQPDGLQISGVEIAATAFANLLDDRHIRPLMPMAALTIIFILGFITSLAFFRLSNIKAFILAVLLIALYWCIAYYQFKQFHLWLPLVIPTLLIVLTVIALTLVKSYDKIKQVLSIIKSTLSENLETDASNSPGPIIVKNEVANGICMFTDVRNYSALSEKLAPRDLKRVMDDYFSMLKEQVKQHNGEVITAQGDEVHAIWRVEPSNIFLQKTQACLACFGIATAVDQFNENRDGLQLPTRIGLHFGEMSLKIIEASYNHSHGATGDTVNTTKRIESTNKLLGTNILLSTKVIDGLDYFLVRPVGDFVLAGMSRQVSLAELISHKQDASDEQKWLCDIFVKGLQAYQEHKLLTASHYFLEILEILPNDGPAKFYLKRCQAASQSWESVIRMQNG